MLLDETIVTARPLTAGGAALGRFFEHIPEDELFYLKEDVTSPGVMAAWAQQIDLERVVPIVAVDDGGSIVADATLHRSRS
jgi:hypothetical protein